MMACEATRVKLMIDPGWICDGTGLVQVIPSGITIPPTVIRGDLLPYIDEATASFLPARSFDGGDHVHLVVRVPLRLPRSEKLTCPRCGSPVIADRLRTQSAGGFPDVHYQCEGAEGKVPCSWSIIWPGSNPPMTNARLATAVGLVRPAR